MPSPEEVKTLIVNRLSTLMKSTDFLCEIGVEKRQALRKLDDGQFKRVVEHTMELMPPTEIARVQKMNGDQLREFERDLERMMRWVAPLLWELIARVQKESEIAPKAEATASDCEFRELL